MDPSIEWEKRLAEVRSLGLYRELKTVEGEQGPRVTVNSREVLLLCSNNYLGLANHPRLRRAAKDAIDHYGTSSAASRLVSGTMTLHQRLEETLAEFKGTEAALIFNCGYMANLGVISSLVGPGDVVLSDELNHASIIDGCRLSKAQIAVYPHRDLDALEGLLKKESRRRCMIVVDGVFSMDGDIAPLPEMVDLAEKYGAFLMVDEAHATGLYGTTALAS